MPRLSSKRRSGASGAWGTSVVSGKLADVAQARGKDERAADHYRESLNLWWGQNNQELGSVEILTGLAILAIKGQPEGAVRLFAVAEATHGTCRPHPAAGSARQE